MTNLTFLHQSQRRNEFFCPGVLVITLSLLLLCGCAHQKNPGAPQKIVSLHVASSEEEKLIKTYFYDDFRKAERKISADIKLAPPEFKIASIDVNPKHAPVYLVAIESPLFCGSIGCGLIIWEKDRGQWQKIGHGNFTEDPIIISDHTTNSFHDLLIDKEYLIWNGRAYEASRQTAFCPETVDNVLIEAGPPAVVDDETGHKILAHGYIEQDVGGDYDDNAPQQEWNYLNQDRQSIPTIAHCFMKKGDKKSIDIEIPPTIKKCVFFKGNFSCDSEWNDKAIPDQRKKADSSGIENYHETALGQTDMNICAIADAKAADAKLKAVY